MTPETARNTFDRALRDELAGHERAEFETALENDAALCAEFEAYSDSRGGADLRAIDQWLRGAGAEASRQRPMIQPGLAESVARKTVFHEAVRYATQEEIDKGLKEAVAYQQQENDTHKEALRLSNHSLDEAHTLLENFGSKVPA